MVLRVSPFSLCRSGFLSVKNELREEVFCRDAFSLFFVSPKLVDITRVVSDKALCTFYVPYSTVYFPYLRMNGIHLLFLPDKLCPYSDCYQISLIWLCAVLDYRVHPLIQDT